MGLLTDLYQLTMAYGYWKTGCHDRQAVFHLFFRKPAFGGGFTVAAGLETVVEYMETLRFDPDDLAYLAGLRGNDGQPLFEAAFWITWPKCGSTATCTACLKARSSFPTNRSCGSQDRCSRPNCWKRHC